MVCANAILVGEHRCRLPGWHDLCQETGAVQQRIAAQPEGIVVAGRSADLSTPAIGAAGTGADRLSVFTAGLGTGLQYGMYAMH